MAVPHRESSWQLLGISGKTAHARYRVSNKVYEADCRKISVKGGGFDPGVEVAYDSRGRNRLFGSGDKPCP
jgi:hypothetical protein